MFTIYMTVSHSLCNRSHYLKFGKVLELGQVSQLQVEAVNAHPSEAVDDVEAEPSQKHENIVNEDHVVDNTREGP